MAKVSNIHNYWCKMIHFFNTIANLKQFLDKFPDQTPLAVRMKRLDGTIYLDDLNQVELVYINEKCEIVGDEANDYQPKENELLALMMS